jgi:hypothetical protein
MNKSLKDKLIENLIKMGGKKSKEAVDFIKPSLLIKHKKAGIKYTVHKIMFDNNRNPVVICYRYYSPQGKFQKKVFISINKNEFKNYEPV